MSDSPKGPLVPIKIEAGDPTTEIFLIDSDLQLVGQSVGVLNVEKPAGLYQVKLQEGTNTSEDLIKLGKEPFFKAYPPLEFSSPVPLSDTRKTHEFHRSNAEAHSKVEHVNLGSGSFIYIFARDWTSQSPGETNSPAGGLYSHPARGLTLVDMSGAELVNFGEQSETQLNWEPWAACNVCIDPGSYILRLRTPDGSIWERTLIASPNWQTQCFLLQRDYSDSRGPDLAGATVLIREEDLGFEPNGHELRLVESARLGLMSQRPILSNEVEDLLTRKFENPLLGIFGAHLLIELEQTRGRVYEEGLLQQVVEKLRGLLKAPHPDVEALAWKAGLGDPDYRFEIPPMLRRGWSLMTQASAQAPNVIPANSMNAQIYDRLLAQEPWLIWSGDQQSDDENPALETLALYLQTQERDQESATEFERSAAAESTLASFELPQDIPDEEDEVRRLTEQLSIPRSIVEECLPQAKEKAKDLRRQSERSGHRGIRGAHD
jgi:hypothetical protein